MKNFSELLAIELHLTVDVNGVESSTALDDFLVFDENDTVHIDGIQVLPKYKHLSDNGVLVIPEPFYCWYHRVSGQGWLLKPY